MDRLAELFKNAQAGDAPVERWNPPYCGDIGLAIHRDGSWHYRGSAITRPALVKLFARVLRRDDDGRYFLVTPAEKVDVAVADAPFLAVELQAEGRGSGQTLLWRTNVDDVVRSSATHPIRFEAEAESGGLKPYIRVRGRLDALVGRALVYDLAGLATEGPDGDVGVWSGGAFFRFPTGQA